MPEIIVPSSKEVLTLLINACTDSGTISRELADEMLSLIDCIVDEVIEETESLYDVSPN